MHIAMDLGENNTRLAAWKEGQPANDPSLLVKLPGLAHFDLESGSDPWNQAHLQKYINYLQREYLLPTRQAIDSAAAAIPGVPGLLRRRRILDVLEETLGLDGAQVVPRSLAGAAGFQLHRPESLGDMMLLEAQGDEVEATFLSSYPGFAVTLEGQCRGDARFIRDMAAQLGFFSSNGWNLDNLYLSGDIIPGTPMEQLIASVPQRIPVHCADDLPLAAVQGLSPHNDQARLAGSLGVIYPYNFYLAVYHPEGQIASMNRIPFDFANLELDCSRRYTLTTLAIPEIHAGEGAQERIHFGIFEYNRQLRPEPPFTLLGDAVLEIDCRREDLPQRIDLVLDMGAAVLLPDIPAPRNDEDDLVQGDFWELYGQDMARIKQLTGPDSDTSLALSEPSASPRSAHSALARQVDDILVRLQWLLSQWNRV